MRLTVLGGAGAWPSADQPCSGYLLEHAGYTLLLDPGYGSFAALSRHRGPESVDAVLVSHGHPDHCADLNPLLRARALGAAAPELPVYAPPGALDRVLELDQVPAVRAACRPNTPSPGEPFRLGPFTVTAISLPHHVPNYGFRITATASIAFTGDTGPSERILELAEDAALLLAEATYPESVPEEDVAYLSSARLAGDYAERARVGELLLTHLWPGTEPDAAIAAARTRFAGPIHVAKPGLCWSHRGSGQSPQ